MSTADDDAELADEEILTKMIDAAKRIKSLLILSGNFDAKTMASADEIIALLEKLDTRNDDIV